MLSLLIVTFLGNCYKGYVTLKDESLSEDKGNKRFSGQSRRANRAKRVDVYREWTDGKWNEDAPEKERWSREGRNPRRKVEKSTDTLVFSEMCKGLLVEQHRRTATVRLEDGKELKARYSPNLGMEGTRSLAVGDELDLGFESMSEEWYISNLLPRRSKLSRPGPPDREHREQILACNIDQVVVVTSAGQPTFNPGFVDRFLMVAQHSEIPLKLVVNKVDLVDEIPAVCREFEEFVDEVVYVSAHDQEGFESLQAMLKDKFSVFTGQSGVGKSTLISKLIPGLDLLVGDVRDKDGRGRHTTTVSGVFDLPFDGRVVDTPGIRGLGFWDLTRLDLAQCFPAFSPWIGQCKFGNCQHKVEPSCAVRKAMEENQFSARLWDSYLRILDSLEE